MLSIAVSVKIKTLEKRFMLTYKRNVHTMKSFNVKTSKLKAMRWREAGRKVCAFFPGDLSMLPLNSTAQIKLTSGMKNGLFTFLVVIQVWPALNRL